MNNLNQYDSLNDEQLEIIHKTSEEFESGLHHDQPIKIEEYLRSAPNGLGEPLFRELFEIELEWAKSRGHLPDVAEYLARFPEHQPAVQELYDVATAAQPLSHRSSTSSACVSLDAGTVVANRHTIVRLIGEGGMGSVYLAEQQQPVQRQVALKLIKSGMDSKNVIARFNAERQALARMDHPHIAKVYDGGSGVGGQPYFAMELVQGLPITQFCDAERLTIVERLSLFVLVGEAVQHAHAKGIIHRDLKPANILVSRVDGRPRPKIIDFGVAKAIGQPLTDESLGATAVIVGTPAYMSPEQADASTVDIDTRTDVYSLGVVLYELLVGSPPHESRSSQGGVVAELLRLVRDADSPRPSVKLSEAKELRRIAADRDIEPRRLLHLLKSELDWIVLKALERDRERRYETPNAFANDIERYLAGDVVEAQPPSAVYRLKKVYLRYRPYVIAASLLVVALLAGTVGTAWGWWEAKRQAALVAAETLEKDQALRDKDNALWDKDRALQNEARERAYAEAIADFVTRDFLALTSLEGRLDFDDQDVALTKDSTLRDLLDRAALKLDRRSDLEPRIEARLRSMIGRSYHYLGEYQPAIDAFQRARELLLKTLGPNAIDTLDAQDNLAEVLTANGKYEDARLLLDASLSSRLATDSDQPGETSRESKRETLRSMGLLATVLRRLGKVQEATELLERSLALHRQTEGPEAHNTLTNMYDLGLAYKQAGKRDQAIAILEEALTLQNKTLGADHPDTNTCSGALGVLYGSAGKFEQALPLVEQDLKWTVATYGEDHPKGIYALSSVAAVYRDSGQFSRAIEAFAAAMEKVKTTFGPDHPNVGFAAYSLAISHRAAGQDDQALEWFELAWKQAVDSLGAEHSTTLMRMSSLASCYDAIGDQEKAQAMHQQCVEQATAALGAESGATLSVNQDQAYGYWLDKQFERSLPLFEHNLKSTEQKFGRTASRTVICMANLGSNYRDVGRYAEAIALLEEANAAVGSDVTLDYVGIELLEAYFRSGEEEKGDSLLGPLLESSKRRYLAGSQGLGKRLATIGESLRRSCAHKQAEVVLRESLAVFNKHEPESWNRYSVLASIGQSQLEQWKVARLHATDSNNALNEEDEQLSSAGSYLREAIDGLERPEHVTTPVRAERLLECRRSLAEIQSELDKQIESSGGISAVPER